MEIHELGLAFANIDQLMEETVERMNDEGIGNTPDDPRVVILFKTTGTYDQDNAAEYTSTVYVDGSDAEIAADLRGEVAMN